MSNQAMKATAADVRGQELPARRRGQSRRNWSGKRAMFTQRHGRTSYRGASRHRDTQVMPGHPLGGLWPRQGFATRSRRPEVRRWAAKKVRTEGLGWLYDDETLWAGVDARRSGL